MFKVLKCDIEGKEGKLIYKNESNVRQKLRLNPMDNIKISNNPLDWFTDGYPVTQGSNFELHLDSGEELHAYSNIWSAVHILVEENKTVPNTRVAKALYPNADQDEDGSLIV